MTATIILISIIITIFLLDTFVFIPKGTKIFTKKHLINGDKTGYITKALKLDYQKIVKGQVWRLFSQVFLHVGLPHLVFNSMAILIVGYALENAIGWQRTILGFFFSTFFSGLIIAFGLKFTDGEGASTGIYGLIAIFIVVAIKNGTIMFSNLHWIFIVILGIYTVVGMLLSSIDRWEHSTGFIGGMIFSLIAL